MKRQLCGILACLLCLAGTVRADDAADARAIVDKAIAAKGGAELLAKYKAQTIREKGTYYGMGAGLPYTGTTYADANNRSKTVIEGVFSLCVDGEKGWMEAMGNTMDLPPEQHAAMVRDMQAGWIIGLAGLNDEDITLATLPGDDVDGKPTDAVLVTSKDKREHKLYFDRETHLLSKAVYQSWSQEKNGEVEQELLFSAYKPIEGIQSAFKVVIMQDGKKFVESDVQEVKFSESLDEKIFKRP